MNKYEVHFNEGSGEWDVRRLIHMSLPDDTVGSFNSQEEAEAAAEQANLNLEHRRKIPCGLFN